MLRYYFFYLNDDNKLYECWIFYKILEVVCDNFQIKFKQGKLPSHSTATFRTEDGSVKMTFQRVYQTNQFDEQGKYLIDIPDILMELGNGIKIVIDAKNGYYKRGHLPYRRQIRDYMDDSGAKYGILIFSNSESNIPKKIMTSDGEQATWTCLKPLAYKRGRKQKKYSYNRKHN